MTALHGPVLYGLVKPRSVPTQPTGDTVRELAAKSDAELEALQERLSARMLSQLRRGMRDVAMWDRCAAVGDEMTRRHIERDG